MFMFVPGVCVPVRSPERSNCTDKQVKHSDFGLSAFSIGMLRGSFHLHHSPASVCCFIPSDPIEMSSAGFPAKLVFLMSLTSLCGSSAIFVTLGSAGSAELNKTQKKPPEQHVPVVLLCITAKWSLSARPFWPGA